jgi:hypothetical protein
MTKPLGGTRVERSDEVKRVGATATLALFVFAIGILLPTLNVFAGCTGLSGNFAIQLQGFAAPGTPTQPAAGFGAIQLNPATCTVTGELIYNANGSVVAYPTLVFGANPGFSGTSAQLNGSYSMRNQYSGTISFTDNGACSGCSNSGLAFNFAIEVSRGSEIHGTSTGSGPILAVTAEKQAAFNPTQLVGAYPFSCTGVSDGNPSAPFSLSGTMVYPSTTCLFPAFSGNCVGGSIVFNNSGTTVTDGLYAISPQSPNSTDATLNDEDVLGIRSGPIPLTEMSRVLWGSANQYHWIIGTNFPAAGTAGDNSADVVSCAGGADPAGTVVISPTTMSLVTSPTNPLKMTATRQVTITNDTARYLGSGGSYPNSGPPPVDVINDNCGQYGEGYIPAFSSCSFTVICTNSGGTSVTSVPISVTVDQAATNDPTNVVNVSCTN